MGGVSLANGDIRAARKADPNKRERDLARELGISEARYLDAWRGEGVTRLRPELGLLFPRLREVGELMALTRNEYAVHEKIGTYENYSAREHVAMLLGAEIDMRIFPSHWVHAFAVEKNDGQTIRRSIQIFDAHGEAVHKIHTRPASKIDAWEALVSDIAMNGEEAPAIADHAASRPVPSTPSAAPDLVEKLRGRWSRLKDTHQFQGMLRKLGVDRLSAIRAVEGEYSWRLVGDAPEALLNIAANERVPVMVFVRNAGCLQVHSGAVSNIKRTGAWLNVMDKTFHLHLRTDAIAECWLVRRPAGNGDVLSVEAFDSSGTRIILFNGVPGAIAANDADWRMLVEGLPRLERLHELQG